MSPEPGVVPGGEGGEGGWIGGWAKMVGRYVSLFGVAVSVGHVRKETTTKSKLMGISCFR